MDPRQYIESRKFTLKEFAGMVGITATALCNYLAGKRMPRLEIAKAMEVASNGKILMEDWIDNWEKKNGKTI